MENKESTALAGGFTLLIGVPTTRSFLFNLLIRRFRSEESLYRSAERRSGKLKELMELQEKEFEKLEERAVLAAEEMSRGMGKLTAAGAQLRKLRSQAIKTETRYTDLLHELRRIPGGQSMALRTQVAETASYARRQRQAVEKRLSQIIRQGIDV